MPHRRAILEEAGLLRHTIDDRLTMLCHTAAELTFADSSSIGVVTDDEQWNLAAWPVGGRQTIVTPIQYGLGEIVVGRSRAVQIFDLLADPAGDRVPWSAIYRSYLGVPVVVKQQVVGAFNLLSVEPRRWSTQDIMALEGLATLVEISISYPTEEEPPHDHGDRREGASPA